MSKVGLVLLIGVFPLLAQVNLQGTSHRMSYEKFQAPNLPQVHTGTEATELKQGRQLAQKGAYAEAVPLLEKVLRKDPNALDAFFWLGYCREQLGDLEGALKAYEQLSQKSPQPEVAYRIGLLKLVRGQPSEALGPLEEAARARPQWAAAQALYGAALLASEKPLESLKPLHQAAILDSTNASTFLWLGDAYFAVDSFLQAEAAFYKALRLDSALLAAKIGLGKSLLAQMKPREALPYLQEAAQASSADASTYYYLGVAQKLTDQPQAAKSSFQKALALDPNHARSHYELILLYVQEKKPAEAEPHYQALQKLNPKLAARAAPLLGK